MHNMPMYWLVHQNSVLKTTIDKVKAAQPMLMETIVFPYTVGIMNKVLVPGPIDKDNFYYVKNLQMYKYYRKENKK